MSTESEKKSGIEARLGAVAATAARRPVLTLLVALAVTGAGVLSARSLKLDTDLSRLLPEDFDSVLALQDVDKAFGGFGYVAVMGSGAEPEHLRAFADEADKRLSALPSVRNVEVRRPVDFFAKQFLYYLDVEDLETLHQRIKKRMDYEKGRSNPLFVDLGGSEAPPVEVDDLVAKYDRSGGNRLRQSEEPYYLNAKTRQVALFVKPRAGGSELKDAGQVVADVKATLGQMDPADYGGIQIQYGGTFTKRVDQQALIKSDLRTATIVATLLILMYVVFHFRRVSAVAFIFVPLAMGLAITFGIAALAFGSLNILTGFIGAILLGLGIDHGIHLLGRLQSEMQTRDFPDAVRHAFAHTGRSVLLAGLTTAVAFVGIALSRFRAFHEFGVIAALGVAAVLAAFLVVLPALVALALRAGWTPSEAPLTLLGRYADWVQRRAATLLIASAVLVAGLGFSSLSASFDYDTRTLAQSNLDSFRLDSEFDALRGYAMSPVVTLVDDPAAERKVARAFRQRQKERGDKSTIDLVMARSDFVPSRQDEKQKIIAKIGEEIEAVSEEDFEGDDRDNFKRLQTAVTATPITFDDLPQELRQQFQNPSGEDNSAFVLVFSSIDGNDGEKLMAFANEVRDVPMQGGGVVSAAGESMIIADCYALVSSESPWVLGLTVVLVLIAMTLLLRSLRAALIGLIPAFTTLVGTFGLLPLLGMQFNTLNIVMIPVLFGLGVDGGVHLMSRLEKHAQKQTNVHEALADTALAILGAILTTVLGFGALILADHTGLNSLGAVALIGLGMNAISCVLVFPALLLWRRGPLTPRAGVLTFSPSRKS